MPTTTPGDESGQYLSTFTCNDGVVGKTKWTIQNIHTTELDKEEAQGRCFKPGPVEGVFKDATEWSSSDSAEIEDQPGHQNVAMLTNAAVGTVLIYLSAAEAFCPELAIILSIIDCGLGSYLDSTSSYGRETRTINRELVPKWWTMDNYASLNLESLSATSFEELLDESDWMIKAAPNCVLHVQSRDTYDIEGFKSRGPGGFWHNPSMKSAGSDFQRWYHFKYMGTGGSNGGPNV